MLKLNRVEVVTEADDYILQTGKSVMSDNGVLCYQVKHKKYEVVEFESTNLLRTSKFLVEAQTALDALRSLKSEGS